MASTRRSLPGFSQSGSSKPCSAQLAWYVGGAQVRRQVAARGVPRAAAGSVDSTAGMLTASSGWRSGAAASRTRSRPCHPLGRDQVREGAVGVRGGQGQHPLPQRGQQDRRLGHAVDHRSLVDRGSIGGQVLAHPGQRPVEGVAAQPLGEVRVRDAEAQHESAAGRLLQGHAPPCAWSARRGPRSRRCWSPAARLEVSPASMPEQGERLTADRLRHPQRPEAELLDARGVGPRRSAAGIESRWPHTPSRPSSTAGPHVSTSPKR